MYVPNGMIMQNYLPAAEGTAYGLFCVGSGVLALATDGLTAQGAPFLKTWT